MRLYHRILVLAALFMSLNVAFQGLWLRQFSHVRDSLSEFDVNLMPSVRQAGELMRLTTQFRNLELRYILAGSDPELASLARAMSRLAAHVKQCEDRLGTVVSNPEERRAFADYLANKEAYVRENRAVLETMLQGRQPAAASLAKDSARFFTAMGIDLEIIERVNMELGAKASYEAEERFRRVLFGMALAAAASAALAVGAAVLTARRIGKPIADLARHMALQDDSAPATLLPAVPHGAPREVAVLYKAFGELSAKLAASMERLANLADTDQLTGLANRRKFMEEGPRILDICRRAGHPCSVVMMDIDHFKAVNDTHGHAAGDAVLTRFARVLRGQVRASDIPARVGGEEFVLLAPNSGQAETLLLAERLRNAVELDRIAFGELRLNITASFGVCSDGPGIAAFDELLRQADQALYSAKRNGRNRVETTDEAP